MNIIVTNSPVIPSGPGAGTSSEGTYTELGGNVWIFTGPFSPPGFDGGIYLSYDDGGWLLYSSYSVIIAQSNEVEVSVPPWQATWPSPMVVALETTCDPTFDIHAYGDECGEKRFLRLRLLGYL